MAVKIETKCSAKNSCRFKNRCILIRPIKTKDPNDAGGDFSPILKIRLIKTNLEVRCFSFTEIGG